MRAKDCTGAMYAYQEFFLSHRKLAELESELSEKHSLVLNKEKQDEQVSPCSYMHHQLTDPISTSQHLAVIEACNCMQELSTIIIMLL